jgi:cell division protein YceG involved in septum cleavage
MTEETKTSIALSVLVILVVSIAVTAIIIGINKRQEEDEYISRHKYFVTVPNGKYSHTYYTNEYKEENGILYFVVDGKKIQHKGEYTLGENK